MCHITQPKYYTPMDETLKKQNQRTYVRTYCIYQTSINNRARCIKYILFLYRTRTDREGCCQSGENKRNNPTKGIQITRYTSIPSICTAAVYSMRLSSMISNAYKMYLISGECNYQVCKNAYVSLSVDTSLITLAHPERLCVCRPHDDRRMIPIIHTGKSGSRCGFSKQ